jgi:hypothetical protein
MEGLKMKPYLREEKPRVCTCFDCGGGPGPKSRGFVKQKVKKEIERQINELVEYAKGLPRKEEWIELD